MDTITAKSGQTPRTETNQADRRFRVLNPGATWFRSDWSRALFIHYEVEAALLQPFVPFELDLWQGRALISLVAFTMRRLRPHRGGAAMEWLFRPIATHGLLNLRTYVRGSQESGIYFLAEWIPNRLSCWLGPLTYGLPYRLGALDYQHAHESGELGGRVQVDGASFAYEAEFRAAESFQPAGPGSLGEFASERYTAFTGKGRIRRCFHIAHAAWPQREVSVKVTDDSLLRQGQPWFAGARFAGAHYSPGVTEVWMSRPRWLGGLRV